MKKCNFRLCFLFLFSFSRVYLWVSVRSSQQEAGRPPSDFRERWMKKRAMAKSQDEGGGRRRRVGGVISANRTPTEHPRSAEKWSNPSFPNKNEKPFKSKLSKVSKLSWKLKKKVIFILKKFLNSTASPHAPPRIQLHCVYYVCFPSSFLPPSLELN